MIRIKICGITKLEQGRSIAQLGATALGFICVRSSPRYVLAEQIRAIVQGLPDIQAIDRVGVFADHDLEEICRVVAIANLNGVQLHGSESPEFCAQLRSMQPDLEIIKALRVRNVEALALAHLYQGWVDTLLLDAYHPALLGGTGHTIDWSILQAFRPGCPWILAGGLTPANVLTALNQVQPDGIDLSSSVEHTPGDKDLVKVAELFDRLGNNWRSSVTPNLR